MTSAIPIKIANYRLKTTLGAGTFAKVKLGQNELSQHLVAVKVANRKKIKMLGMKDKLMREIKVMRTLSHPHLIKMFECIETKSDIFIVTEFCPNGDFFDYIASQGRIAEAEAREFFIQLLSAVEYLHKHKVAHRDLKPENVLLDENNNIKLADLGLCNSIKEAECLRTSCGSSNYAAPEILK